MNHQLSPGLVSLTLTLIAAPPLFAQSGRAKDPPANPPTVQGPLSSSPVYNPVDFKSLPTEIDGERIYRGRELDQKVRVTKKPEPKYTKEARKKKQEGTVTLLAVFDSTGHVTHLRIVYGLPYGLTDRAIEAAKQIQFPPGLKDGHPVSMWMELQYNFNLR